MSTKISLEGFKAIGDRVDVELRPLTLLAGANSSGKSSLMQGLLLLKQTIESQYDPGPILLHGPHVRFTSVEQLLHTEVSRSSRADGFTVGIDDGKSSFETRIERSGSKQELTVSRFKYRSKGSPMLELTPDADAKKLMKSMPKEFNKFVFFGQQGFHIEIVRDRFALVFAMVRDGTDGTTQTRFPMGFFPVDYGLLRSIIHIPGHRGNPERSYALTGTGPSFPGTFESYSASVIARWGENDSDKLKQLGKNLQQLGLTWKVEAKKVDGANVELRVGRMPRSVVGGGHDLVNIVDVGFGVSQTLPVLVALIEAKRGQLVYIEQPEIHLHPRAQVAMAGLLADAAKRGVVLVVETHSSSLLLAIQTLVAEGSLPHDLVKLHWFTRDEKSGATKIDGADLDEAGRFGEDWPEDFDDVALKAQSRYLDAVEAAVAKE
jgi:predicted ATPase